LSALKLTVHVLVLLLLGASVQGLGVMLEVDPAGPLILKPTVPSGALLVPLAVSVTVTVHASGLFAGVEGGQSTVVVVVRAMTWILAEPLLLAWIEPAAGL
jgi:hypothetical protein